MQDRQLGYFVLAILALFVFVLSAYLIKVSYFPAETRVVIFPEVGNLKIEDPVNVRGVMVGRIQTIQSHQHGVAVKIVLKEKQTIYENYSILTVDKGLMGDRVVAIDPGLNKFAEIAPTDTLKGVFVPGISEAVGLAWKLKETIEMYRDVSTLFLEGSGDEASFTEQFNNVTSNIDTFTSVLLVTLPKLDKEVSKQLEKIDRLAAKASIFSRQAGSVATEYSEMLVKFVTETSTALDKLESLVKKLIKLVDTFENKEKTVWRGKLKNIQNQIKTLRKMIKEIKKHGLAFRVKIVF